MEKPPKELEGGEGGVRFVVFYPGALPVAGLQVTGFRSYTAEYRRISAQSRARTA